MSRHFLAVLACLALCTSVARATTTTYSGSLATSESTYEPTLTLGSASDVTIQTYSFGEGETDLFVGMFDSSGNILTYGTGCPGDLLTCNPFGTSLDLTNYSSFSGCPPASTETIGGSPVCGDITMGLSDLAAGTYTILISDGNYQPNAVYDNGNLSEGFTDLTGGQFCNLVINGVDCTQDTGSYDFTVTTTPLKTPPPPAPEPASLALLVSGLLGIAGFRKRRA